MSVQARRQEERSAATRHVLLEATVACLVDLGYTGTTSAAVAAKAGLSRGAQLHHFGTRDQLVVAAVEYLAQKRLRRVREALADLSPPATPQGAKRSRSRIEPQEAALGLLAEALSGPLYAATLELWVRPLTPRSASPVDPSRGARQRRACADLSHLRHRRPGHDPAHPRPPARQGGVSGLLTSHPGHRQEQVLAAWAQLLRGRPPHD